MSSEIPLKIRVDVRDHWDSSKAPVHAAVESLTKTLGHRITPEAEWPALWSELQGRFADKSAFAPTVSRYVISWYERLLERIDSDIYAAWTEDLLSALADGGKKLRVEPSSPNITRPITKWNKSLSMFVLGVPNTDPVSQAQVTSFFDRDFDNFFTDAEVVEGEWADVAKEKMPVAQAAAHELSDPFAVKRLPGIDSLARPPELFMSTGPYILIVRYSSDAINVECSHEPSLQLLAAYLKKWGKTNPNDSLKRPMFKTELVESDFCFGIIDSLTIQASMKYWKSMNPTIVLGFIEGVLGYEMVHTTGAYWMYRSKTLLK